MHSDGVPGIPAKVAAVRAPAALLLHQFALGVGRCLLLGGLCCEATLYSTMVHNLSMLVSQLLDQLVLGWWNFEQGSWFFDC